MAAACHVVVIPEPVVLIERCVIQPPPEPTIACDPCDFPWWWCDDWAICDRIDRFESSIGEAFCDRLIDTVDLADSSAAKSCADGPSSRKPYAVPLLAEWQPVHDSAPPDLADLSLVAYQRVTNLGTLFDLIA